MPLDIDTRFALFAAPIGGALGSLSERLVTHLKTLTNLAIREQTAFLQGRLLEIGIYVIVAAIITTAGILLFPINRQNRAQLIGTAIVFGMVWPSVLDKLLQVAGATIPTHL